MAVHRRKDRAHDEREAQRLLDGGLAAAGLSTKELDSLPGSDVRKVALANLLLERTVARQRWIAEKLAMRSAANVSQQVHRYRAKRPSLTVALKQYLQCQDLMTALFHSVLPSRPRETHGSPIPKNVKRGLQLYRLLTHYCSMNNWRDLSALHGLLCSVSKNCRAEERHARFVDALKKELGFTEAQAELYTSTVLDQNAEGSAD